MKPFLAAISIGLCAIGSAASARADVVEPYQKAGNLAVYLGLLPAEIAKGHPAGHPEASMHSGSSAGPRDVHLVAAVFDEAGNRIENADVSATVLEIGDVDIRRVRLEPMTIAGTVTYGAFVPFPQNQRQKITIEVRRPGETTGTKVDFTYVPAAQ